MYYPAKMMDYLLAVSAATCISVLNTYNFKIAHPDIIKAERLCRVDNCVGEKSQTLKFKRLVISIQNQMLKRVQHEAVFHS
jgi:hypothetical protein